MNFRLLNLRARDGRSTLVKLISKISLSSNAELCAYFRSMLAILYKGLGGCISEADVSAACEGKGAAPKAARLQVAT